LRIGIESSKVMNARSVRTLLLVTAALVGLWLWRCQAQKLLATGRPFAALRAQRVSLVLTRDEWLTTPDFALRRTGAAANPRLLVFNQFDCKPCLNLASKCTLTALPGIGPKTASAIIALRDSGAAIGSADDLLAIPGLGKKRLSLLSRVFSFAKCRGHPQPRSIRL